MPATICPLTEAQYAAILDLQGHEPCSGVAIEFDVELRPALVGQPRQYATIFRPEQAGADPAPAVLAFHGGGFCGGDPNGTGALAKAHALALGIVTISVSYRLGTEAAPTGAAILDDAAHAWRWVHAHAAELGIDPTRIALSGESAGCLLAGHLAVRSPWVTRELEHLLPAPAALYAQWGPLDFVARWYDNGECSGAELNIFGPGGFAAHPVGYHQLSALAHLNPAHPPPPALFVYGRSDPVVHPRQGRLGLAAWQELGCHAELLVLPNIGHGVQGDNREQRRQAIDKAVVFAAWRHAARS
jgi:acetyl esterase/lipase